MIIATLGATRLVGYLRSHIQRALVEQMLIMACLYYSMTYIRETKRVWSINICW